MRFAILTVLLAFALYLIYRYRGRPAAVNASVAAVRDLPSLLGQLQRTGRAGSFVGVVVYDPARPDTDPMNVQFSLEEGRVGFDWLLVQQLNIDDRDRFVALLDANGYTYRTLEANGVPYLRVDHGDLGALAMRVMSDLYGLKPDDEVDLVLEGVEWPPAASGSADGPG